MRIPTVFLLLAGAVLAHPAAVSARADLAVAPAARVAIVGDSITEQKLYSKFMECYLLASSGVPDVQVMQFGWGGERANGFATRGENDLAVFRPTLATLCYGMNDGGYQPWNDGIGAEYEKNMRSVLSMLQGAGVRTIVVGSPGAVDTNFFRPGQKMGDRPAHEAYNDTLAHLRDIDRKLATEGKWRFADVHAAMFDAMTKANAARGATYDVCGRDGFHPGPNGQLLMAYAFLKALGCDGDIGRIEVAAGNGVKEPGPGHRLVSQTVGPDGATVELESTRWPFCFDGNGQESGGTRSILPFVPFNQDLNRFTLQVTGLDSPKAEVVWGEERREFTKEQLAAGVNLAAEFTKTPFDQAFARLQAAVAAKQGFETFMIKQIVTDFRLIPGIEGDEEARKAADVLSRKLMARWEELDKAARSQVVPVRHTVTVKALR
jgi:lysophospholipase L1-like esterase